MKRGAARWLAAVAAAVAFSALAVHCTDPTSAEAVTVMSARTEPRSRTVHLALDSCNAEVHDVHVDESAASVVVQVSILRGNAEEDCQDSTSVELQRPLGHRRLMDATSGERAYVDVDRTQRYSPVSRARRAQDDRTLELQTHLCTDARIEVLIDEEPDRVTVAIPRHRVASRNRCIAESTVVLEEPLADRQLVDLSTGGGIDLAGP